jgi:hypothetical protein
VYVPRDGVESQRYLNEYLVPLVGDLGFSYDVSRGPKAGAI